MKCMLIFMTITKEESLNIKNNDIYKLLAYFSSFAYLRICYGFSRSVNI